MARAARAARASSTVVDTSLLAFCLLSSLIVTLLPAALRDRAAGSVRRTVVAPLAELQRRAEVSRAAFVSYDDRMQSRGELARRAVDAQALQTENERLRRLLGLGARLEWGFITAEAIPNQLASELVQRQMVLTFTVTAGSRAGVAPFTPVVATEGLVGMVQSADPTMSLAITYSHPDFRVSAQTADGVAYGIVQPHLGSGAERGLLEIRGVAFRTPLKAGQLVVSSGLGATYPKGIPVGTVIREVQTPEKWARTYLLQPAVALADVGPVMLLLKRRTDAGVDSVWTSVQAVDSASRSVAAAGDSLARAAILRETLQREAEARRQALDSTVRDTTARDSTAAPPAVEVIPGVPATAAPRPAAPAAPRSAGARTDSAPRPRATVPAAPRADSAARPRPTVPATAPRTAPRPTTDSAARPRPATTTPPRPAAPRPTVPRPTVPTTPRTAPDTQQRTGRARTAAPAATVEARP